VETVGE